MQVLNPAKDGGIVHNCERLGEGNMEQRNREHTTLAQ